MADETSRDELLRGRFTKLRDRVREAMRSAPTAAPVDANKDRGAEQREAVPESPQHEELTQKRMDAMRSRFYAEKFRLEVHGFEQQRWKDIRRNALRHVYANKKKLAVEDNRVDAFFGDAKELPANEIDNRPGEKFLLRRTRGMARKESPEEDIGPSP